MDKFRLMSPVRFLQWALVAVLIVPGILLAADNADTQKTGKKADQDASAKESPEKSDKQKSKKRESESTQAFEPYTEELSGTDVTFDMVPIQGGVFKMGSPKSEKGHQSDEGPVHKVRIDPFWMGKHEVTWDEYDIWTYSLDIKRRKVTGGEATAQDKAAAAVTRPTKPYTDMTFAMGHDGYPAICMTQLAARMYCRWLSEKTGHFYRLPTEAEWEYACRAGTRTAYSWGNDPSKLPQYAWCQTNAFFTYHKVGQLKPNPWGLYDMHGNAAEWTLDAYDPGFYATFEKGEIADNPVNVPTISQEFGRVVRGGSWRQPAVELRSASREGSVPAWKQQDPQRPQSIWYLTDALHVGFRVVRPLDPAPKEVRVKLGMVPRPGEVTAEGLEGGFIDDGDGSTPMTPTVDPSTP